VEVVEQAPDHGEQRRVVDIVGDLAAQPGKREHLGAALAGAHRGDRSEHQELRDALEQEVGWALALAHRGAGG